jgi:hypothetical protein
MPGGTLKRPNLFVATQAKEGNSKKPRKLRSQDSTDELDSDSEPEMVMDLAKKGAKTPQQNPIIPSTSTQDPIIPPLTPPPEEYVVPEDASVRPLQKPADLFDLNGGPPIEKRADIVILTLSDKTTIHVLKG